MISLTWTFLSIATKLFYNFEQLVDVHSLTLLFFMFFFVLVLFVCSMHFFLVLKLYRSTGFTMSAMSMSFNISVIFFLIWLRGAASIESFMAFMSFADSLSIRIEMFFRHSVFLFSSFCFRAVDRNILVAVVVDAVFLFVLVARAVLTLFFFNGSSVKNFVTKTNKTWTLDTIFDS